MVKRILTVTLNPAIDQTLEIPNFNINSVNRVQNSRKDPGGKGINVATALSDGEITCDVTGFLGRDNSEIFENHFTKNQIDNKFIYVDGKTREGIKITDHKNQTTTDINFPGFTVSPKELETFMTSFDEMVEHYDYIIFSGSLPVGIESDIYLLLTSICHKKGKFTAVDSSGETMLQTIKSRHINLLKPNIDELYDLFPEDIRDKSHLTSIDRVIEKKLNHIDIVALSLGDRGSRVYTKDAIYTINTPKMEVKSSVGAGDAYLAGFISGLCHGKVMEEVIKTATCWAASKLTKYGSGLSKDQTPELFLKDLKIQKLPK